MRFEAINELYAPDNCRRWLELLEAKLRHFECQNIIFVQNVLFIVNFRFSYFSGFLSLFEFLSKVLKSYFRNGQGALT